ncbi:MAG TPA: hypothetical protein ENN99_13970, partial [Chloroflexi bacterium]|nr:hypothetical protein [Chloroflexota bacterium]
MKLLKLFVSVSLGLTVLLGVTAALTDWRAAPVRAEQIPDGPVTPRRPTGVQAVAGLPMPFLSDDDVVDAPFDNPPPPTVDGLIAPGEYAGAGKVTFADHGGDVEVFLKQDGAHLYVAFDLPVYPSSGVAYADVYLDTDHDGVMGSSDYLLRVSRFGTAKEFTPTVGGLWGGERSPVSWTAQIHTNLAGGGWQVEFQIEYAKLGITAGVSKTLGLALGSINGGMYLWPAGAYPTGLSSYGDLVSSSDWGTFYWKPGPWEDYAPSGMPDFDQKQNG